MNIEELDGLAKKRVIYTVAGMERVSVKRNIIYKTVGDTTLRMDVYYPLDMQEGTIRPAVLFVHGEREGHISWRVQMHTPNVSSRYN